MKTKFVLTKTEFFELGPFVQMRNLLERNGVVFAIMPTDLRMPRISDLEPPYRVTMTADGALTIEQGRENDDD